MSTGHFVTSSRGVNSFMGYTIPGKGKGEEKLPVLSKQNLQNIQCPCPPLWGGPGQRPHICRQAGPGAQQATEAGKVQGHLRALTRLPLWGLTRPLGSGAVSHGREAQQWTHSPPSTTPSLLLEFPKALAPREPTGSPGTHPAPRCSPLPATGL